MEENWDRTRRGRVVYDRKKHFMTDADRQRMAGSASVSSIDWFGFIRRIQISILDASFRGLGVMSPAAAETAWEVLYEATAEVVRAMAIEPILIEAAREQMPRRSEAATAGPGYNLAPPVRVQKQERTTRKGQENAAEIIPG